MRRFTNIELHFFTVFLLNAIIYLIKYKELLFITFMFTVF